ncbi:MarR family winged helix-turn-helix transcriptional regulator [Terriglobus sp.]|uniref:MarR family winged helix-turn-helix transcriptional regulator n=1 Tax=Terriglobus sp. TaxID=1889013 RepID=UPI003B009D26
MSERLGYLLKRAQHALRTSIDDQLSPLGLTTAQYNLLSAVAFEPGISNAALARMAFVTAQSMQGVIANMEKQGLLRRVPHPTHGRIRRNELTRRGAEILAKAHKVLIGIEERMTEGFDQTEIEALRCALLRCAENMQVTPQ